MPAVEQVVHRAARALPVVHADAGHVFRARRRGVDRGEHARHRQRPQLLVARAVIAAEEDDAAHLALGIHALGIQHFVLAFVDIIRQKAQPRPLNAALQALDDAGKEQVVRPAHDDGDRLGRQLLEVLGVAVGLVPHAADDLHHALARGLVDVRPLVEHARHRADGDARQLGNFFNCDTRIHRYFEPDCRKGSKTLPVTFPVSIISRRQGLVKRLTIIYSQAFPSPSPRPGGNGAGGGSGR